MSIDEQYMRRCLDLAQKGAGFVAPNPMVGAALVHDGKIIGEGWHQRYGEAHAEVNCINDAIAKGHESLISASTLYVSLEPCAHQGKTPPCDQLIIRHKIPRIVIGCRDPFPEVNGKGIEHLMQEGIDVKVGVLESECQNLNKRFFCFHQKHRPYIILKWAQSADGYIGSGTTERWLISNEQTNKLVHTWRGEEAAVIVGANTARLDNPLLTNRSGMGAQPIRVVVDRYLKLPHHLHLFDGSVKTMVLNELKNEEGIVSYVKYDSDKELPMAICEALFEQKVQSVLIEGGAQLLNWFIQSGCWDEARVITNTAMNVVQGVKAPVL
ncbi:MAG: bifunctional diaminohydroxyphosphoribosylaminopyrimidine deaminase/5-amino-6-(5-phosphoribosylamino)uracil reductase RibD, partial [Bacteroidota bacterium]